ncbi:MAG: M20 family peptidase, partial [Pseudomonadota bacterium]|nr:M20 family peptidase [Pseudomonadota bacterium]
MQVHELKQNVIDTIDSMASDLIKVSQDIHARPELAFEEFYAANRLCTMVEDNGLEVTRNAYGLKTAFVSSFGDPNKHDCEVAIISEYDALPGIGHACGHNIIAAAGLGATLALSKLNS